MIREREYAALPGLPMALVLLAVLGLVVYALIWGGDRQSGGRIVGLSVALLLDIFLLAGLFIVNPNEGKVLQFFGSYAGTTKVPGLRVVAWDSASQFRSEAGNLRTIAERLGVEAVLTGSVRRSGSRVRSRLG